MATSTDISPRSSVSTCFRTPSCMGRHGQSCALPRGQLRQQRKAGRRCRRPCSPFASEREAILDKRTDGRARRRTNIALWIADRIKAGSRLAVSRGAVARDGVRRECGGAVPSETTVSANRLSVSPFGRHLPVSS